MKTIIAAVLTVFLICLRMQAGTDVITDPVKDYLDTFSPLGGDDSVYADDHLLRLDIDLFRDGHTEVLLSMARDKNGKQGNSWTVYRDSSNGYANIGGMTFNPRSFYIGPIDRTEKNGLVAFWPSSNGEGVMHAFVLNGGKIQELTLGEVSRDPITREFKGAENEDKYFGRKAKEHIKGEDAIKLITADELNKKYSVKIKGKTYRDSIQEGK